jgi:hypothetical protein
VIDVDRFGNIRLNVRPGDLDRARPNVGAMDVTRGDPVWVSIAG